MDEQAPPPRSPPAAPAGGLAEPAIEGVPGWAVTALVEAGRRLYAQGLAQATAGNLSVRVAPGLIAVTQSGTHKGFLDAGGLMLVDLEGAPAGPGRPSAETGLHCQLYRCFPDTGAVVHAHSVPGTVLSMAGPIRFAGYEVIKAFPGQPTHAADVALPIVENDQDIARLAGAVQAVLRPAPPIAYMIRGHGAYVWAPSMAQALAQAEGLEFLLACELERRKLVR